MMREVKDHSSAVPASRWFKLSLGASIAIALLAWEAPQRRMPLDYDFMRVWSIPTATLWASILALSAVRFRKKALWLLHRLSSTGRFGSLFIGFVLATGMQLARSCRNIALRQSGNQVNHLSSRFH
jgi:hypothetical protein